MDLLSTCCSGRSTSEQPKAAAAMTDDGLVAQASELFTRSFGESLEFSVCTSAPGRVNIVGEHTDYNEGFVCPAALTLRTVVVARQTTTGICRVVSTAGGGLIQQFRTDSTLAPGDTSWAKYVAGTVAQYLDDGYISFDAAFASNVPLGGGLSSSASLEVCTATLCEALLHIHSPDPMQRALRCVEAEHTYAHVPCGIMDQAISSCAIEGHALLLDCRSQKIKAVPLDDPSVCLVVCNSNKSHELTGSEYPDRVRQCSEAVMAVRTTMGTSPEKMTHLRDVSLEQLEQARANMTDVVFRRARHAVTEDARTLRAVEAAADRDYITLGKMMRESHVSLRDDFEVSTPELDALVEIAETVDGVYGSRMTGGGFGGCTVTLVKSGKAAEDLVHTLRKEYLARYGIETNAFVTTPGPGARILWDRR